MARIRTVKPEFWTDEDLSALPEATHMLAAALLNHADDEGYFNANPRLVQAACCPLREPSVSVHESLSLLAQARFIELGVGIDGKRYGRIRKFLEHQRVSRPSPSKIKDLSIDWSDSLRSHGTLSDTSSPERNREQGKEQGKDSSANADSSAPNGADDRKAMPDHMVAIWNHEIGDLLPKPRKLDQTRRAKLIRRLEDDFANDLEQWRRYCQMVRGSPHLIGENDRGWRADLDWCLEPRHVTRILEGRYQPLARRGSDRGRRQATDLLNDLERAGGDDE